MAAQNGNLEIVELLLKRKADINAIDSKGWTPLDRANKWRHPDVAKFLGQRGGHGVTSAMGDGLAADHGYCYARS